MAEILLKADTGRTRGSAASRRLRAEGKIPGVVYGAEVDPTPVAVDWRELRAALTTDRALNALITLDVDGDEHLTIVKELQRHPVRRDVLHIDFLVVQRDTAVHAEVPLVLATEAPKVVMERGVVEQALSSLTVLAKPDNIPGHIDVDITELEIGQTITVADLDLPAGVTTDVDLDETVVTASVTRAVEAEAEAVEGEEGEEGEAAEGEEEGGEEEAGE